MKSRLPRSSEVFIPRLPPNGVPLGGVCLNPSRFLSYNETVCARYSLFFESGLFSSPEKQAVSVFLFFFGTIFARNFSVPHAREAEQV